jgi:hypothetical protein
MSKPKDVATKLIIYWNTDRNVIKVSIQKYQFTCIHLIALY